MAKTAIASLGLIGAGNMGSALIRGACEAHIVENQSVYIYDTDTSKSRALASELGLQVASSNIQVLANTDCVIVAVKPQIITDVLEEIAPAVESGKTFISIAAGITIDLIEDYLGPKAVVIRAMPNTPAMLGKGATAVAVGSNVQPEDVAAALLIFNAVGQAVRVDEEDMNAVTGLSGSGPAYVFRMIEAMTEAGVAAGLTRDVADKLSRQTVLGAAVMAADPEQDPADLRRRVTSPGGTTEAGLEVMDQTGFMDLMRDVVLRARDRGEELGQMKK